MRTPTHGNVSVMETSPRTQQISTRRFLLVLFSVVCLAVSGCYYPPRDNNGNLPDDVVGNFIELVKADNYEAARKLWYGDSKRISGPVKFEDFCARYKKIDLNNCKISKAQRGKSGFSMVDVDWEESGKEKHSHLGLKIVGGEWRMQRGDRW